MPAPALVTVVPVPEIIPEYVPAVAWVIDKAPPLRLKFPEPLNDPVVAVIVNGNVPKTVDMLLAPRATLTYALKVREELLFEIFPIPVVNVMLPSGVVIDTFVFPLSDASMLDAKIVEVRVAVKADE